MGNMSGGANKTPYGYGFTIVEVMIFLAVSGVMFLVAASFISGKDSQAEYYQGMNSANAKVTTIINNAANGNYPFISGRNLNCNATVTGGINVTLTRRGGSVPGSVPPTAQPGCTFIGTVLQTNQNPSEYTLYTIAGCQYFDYTVSGCWTGSGNGFGQVPTTLAQEYPTEVSQMTTQNYWLDGLEIKNMYEVVNGSSTQIYFVGFFSSLPNSSPGVLSSGAQPVSIVVFPSLTSSSSVFNATSASLLQNGHIVMCFYQSSNQRDIGSLSIGTSAGGQQISTDLEMGNGVATQCLS